MWPAVRRIFAEWSAQFEGRVPWPYLDQAKDAKGNPTPILTVGIGNAVLTLTDMLALPWVHKGSSRPATKDEITAAWNAVHARADLAPHGGGAFEGVTDLRLTDDAIDAIVDEDLDAKASALTPSFPGIDAWPADAQLLLFSMAWALGVGKLQHEFPRFCGFMRAEDFRGAATEAHIREEGNPGIIPRNVANQRLAANAAHVLEAGLALNVLLEDLGLSNVPLNPNGAPQRGGGGSRGGFVAGVLLVVATGAAAWFASRSV